MCTLPALTKYLYTEKDQLENSKKTERLVDSVVISKTTLVLEYPPMRVEVCLAIANFAEWSAGKVLYKWMHVKACPVAAVAILST